MSSDWLMKAINHEWMKENQSEGGGIKDGAICPLCNQPRPGLAFLYKKKNVYVSACTSCRRKSSGW